MPESLLNETLDLLEKTDIPIAQVCRDTGTGPRWIYRLMAGDFADPGVNKIERLNRYLKTESADRKQ